MAKMNVATFLMGNISSRLSNELGEHERGIIINQMIESWEDRNLVLFMGFSLLSASEFLPTEKWRCAKQ